MADRPFAVLGLFSSAQAILDAVPKVKARGLRRLEAYTPYPVHHLDEVLGFERSPLGKIVLVMGLLGTTVAVVLQGWTSVVDYPMFTGGKPLFSWQAFVPILFEITVLFATFTSGLAMLFVLNRLPFFGHPVLASKAIASITRDRFALSVEAAGDPLDVDAARSALIAAGAETVEIVNAPPDEPALSLRAWVRTAAAIALACAVAGVATWGAIKLIPVVPPMVHMQNQPRLNPQKPSRIWKDGRGMRMPVPGTVARGHLPYLFANAEEAGAALTNPLPRTPEVLARGRKAFLVHCAVCHGPLGNGTPSLSSEYGAEPANLHASTLREAPDGALYHVIRSGKGLMSSYAADLSEDERWATVHYVRALQRSQSARDEDLP